VHGRVVGTVAGEREQRRLLGAVNDATDVVRPSLTLVRSSLETCHRHVSFADAHRSSPQ
jgi:hypothetical protein